MIEHGWGGGIRRHTENLAAHLGREDITTFLGVADAATGVLRMSVISGEPLELPPLRLEDPAVAAADLAKLRLGRIHIHSLVGFSGHRFAPLLSAVAQAGLSYDFTIHDYAAVCPRVSMVDWGGVYCDNRSEDHCRVCLQKPGVKFGRVDIAAWRGEYGAMLEGARRVFAPDPDVAERLLRFFPKLDSLSIRPHAPLLHAIARSSSGPGTSGTRLIGVVGAIGPEKGSSLLVRLAGDALERNLPIRYRLFGYTDRRELREFPNFEITGRYREEEVDNLVLGAAPDLLFYPAVAPETFCYALDVAFRTGVFPVAFDQGTQAARIRAAGFGAALPLDWVHHPPKVNDALLTLDPRQSEAHPDSRFPVERRWISAEVYYDG